MPILPSHKEGLIYLEHCKVTMKNHMVTYVKKDDAVLKHFGLPYGNVNALLLGPGTSLTQQAARLLSSEGVGVVFVGGGGMPVFLASQSEYRKPEFLQAWAKMWLDPTQRLEAAKAFQRARCGLVQKSWGALFSGKIDPQTEIDQFLSGIQKAKDTFQLLGYEANFAKALFAKLANEVLKTDFTRDKKPKKGDSANHFLSNGNYLAYALAATALWVLGIPHSLPLSHGATRRGALVFDVADLVKDACVMPLAFLCAANGKTKGQFRTEVIGWLEQMNALGFMLNEIRAVLGTAILDLPDSNPA
jgi:CRISP-associated protein Cas1